MAEKKDFMTALAEQVEAQKRGEKKRLDGIDNFVPAKKKEPVQSFQEPVKEKEPEVVNTPAEPVMSSAEKEEFVNSYNEEPEDDRPASFREEELKPVVTPKRSMSPIGIGLITLAVLALAFGIWWFKFAAHIVLPNFVGRSVNEVSSWARQNKMETTAIAMSDSVFSMEYDKDIVVSQSLPAGKKVRPNTPITITVSKGPDPSEEITFPDIRNMTQSELNDWIRENKLSKTKLTTQYSTTVEAGNVISYELKNVDEGDFTRGSTLNIVCSKGPAPAGQATVEDFKGKSIAEVENWAKQKKIHLVQTEAFSDTVQTGMIISQSVASGQALKEGETLSVVVSKGKGVRIPNMVGYSAEQLDAWRAGKNNNVTVVTKSIYHDELEGTVISQSLVPGSVVEAGDVLELTISKYLPILEKHSREWLGKDYLQLVYWVDEVNAQGGSLMAGEYGAFAERQCSDEYPTPGQIINYACEYGTKNSDGEFWTSSGCERPLNLYSRIGYQVSTGACSVQKILLNASDMRDLNTIQNFCSGHYLQFSTDSWDSGTFSGSHWDWTVQIQLSDGSVYTNSEDDINSKYPIMIDPKDVIAIHWKKFEQGDPQPTPTPTPEPTPVPTVVLTNAELTDLQTLISFCDSNDIEYTLNGISTSEAEWYGTEAGKHDSKIEMEFEGNKYYSDQGFTLVLKDNKSVTINYLTDQ